MAWKKFIPTRINLKNFKYTIQQYFGKKLNNQTDDTTAIIQNINHSCIPNQPRLLICYMAGGYLTDLLKYKGRTQYYEIFEIVNTFCDFGYCIDIIYCNDISAVEILNKKKYDLIFGFGESFYLSSQLHKSAISIFYMTEHHPEFSIREENKRLDYFYSRHGKRIPYKRSGIFYKPYHMTLKHTHVITMSETEPLKEQYSDPYSIFPTGISNPDFIFKQKNHEYARKNFLCLGSAGAIHKGLDLLIDVFSNRDDLTLHLGGFRDDEKKFLNIPKSNNIVDYGYIDIKSETFLTIVDKCSFIILLSCSEACSTAITTGMLHGLIPIVMKDAGFNRLGENAIFLNDYKIEYISQKLTEIANFPPEYIQTFSNKVHKFASSNFTVEAFNKSFREIIKDILHERKDIKPEPS